MAFTEVTVEVAGRIQLKEQLRNSTPFGLFVPFRQKSFSELLSPKEKKKRKLLLVRKELLEHTAKESSWLPNPPRTSKSKVFLETFKFPDSL